MKRTFWGIFMRSVRQGPRLYFAPLVGAVKGAIEHTRAEWERVAEEDARYFSDDADDQPEMPRHDPNPSPQP